MGSIMGSQKIMGSDYGSNISDVIDNGTTICMLLTPLTT
jgi:hypothetical protein